MGLILTSNTVANNHLGNVSDFTGPGDWLLFMDFSNEIYLDKNINRERIANILVNDLKTDCYFMNRRGSILQADYSFNIGKLTEKSSVGLISKSNVTANLYKNSTSPTDQVFTTGSSQVQLNYPIMIQVVGDSSSYVEVSGDISHEVRDSSDEVLSIKVYGGQTAYFYRKMVFREVSFHHTGDVKSVFCSQNVGVEPNIPSPIDSDSPIGFTGTRYSLDVNYLRNKLGLKASVGTITLDADIQMTPTLETINTTGVFASIANSSNQYFSIGGSVRDENQFYGKFRAFNTAIMKEGNRHLNNNNIVDGKSAINFKLILSWDNNNVFFSINGGAIEKVDMGSNLDVSTINIMSDKDGWGSLDNALSAEGVIRNLALYDRVLSQSEVNSINKI